MEPLYIVVKTCLMAFLSSIWLAYVVNPALATLASGAFVHPGLLHTQADFDRMKQKVTANASPWNASYSILIGNSHTNLGYAARPQTYANRGSDCSPNNGMTLANDASAAYQMALVWKITGDNRYANKSIEIMNAWSSTLTGIGCQNGSGHDFVLMAAMQGLAFANAAEIMRSYSIWASADFTRFKNMLLNIFYPAAYLQNRYSSYANWDLSCIAFRLALGVVTDNQTIFNDALWHLKNASYSTGSISQSIYYLHPGSLAQVQESGRDQGHNTLDIVHLSAIAEMAWNQGVDLYSYANNRILAASEYVAKGNLVEKTDANGTDIFYTVPFVLWYYNHHPTFMWHTSFSTASIGTRRPCWACIYHHYVNRKGLSAPYTKKMMELLSPDGGGGNYGTNSGGYDALGYQTLTCTRDPISGNVPPSGLSALIVRGAVELSWFGSAYATSYNVKRKLGSTGSYTTIKNVPAETFNYTDSGLSSGTYYYVVTAVTPSGETAASKEAIVTEYTRLIVRYKFDESSGTTAADSSGLGNNGLLVGGASFAAGKNGNALKLDGQSGYVRLPTSIINNMSDFTISTWIYLNSTQSWARLFDFGHGTARWMSFIPRPNGGAPKFIITLYDWDSRFEFTAPTVLPIGQWVHIAVRYFGRTLTYHQNGRLSAMLTDHFLQPYQIPQGTDIAAQYSIGRSAYSNDPYFNGLIEDFRVYEGALYDEQIFAIANAITLLQFDETSGTTASDSSGNGNNGALVNGASFVAGVKNNALKLDGQNDYASLPANLLSNLTDFTITAWVYLNAQQTWVRVFDFGYGTQRWMMFTPRADDGCARFSITVNDWNNRQSLNGTEPLVPGQWVHIAIKLSGNNITYYVNGTVKASSTITLLPSQIAGAGTSQNWLGRSQYSNDPYLNGHIDDFGLYGRALSNAEVFEIATANRLSTDLRFDETSGTTASDFSGNENNGVLLDGVTYVTGKTNNAVAFNGNISYVSLPVNVISTLSDFTISAWIYLNSQQAYARVFDFGFGAKRWMMFSPRATDGYPRFSMTTNDFGSAQHLIGSEQLAVGQWIHIAITKSGNIGTYYVNGAVKGTNTGMSVLPSQLGSGTSSTAQIWLGRSQYSNDPYLNGTIDSFKVYRSAFSAAQIAVLATL